ncbi:2-(3-amino-3-carboxypropyl)histidine synthase subunit 2 [Microplitis demolitor]|uniref:2-(3-amino-3-carboxypropyl)histidine synthase subunit 2 n=1 Tax=Microplitis demolitor TaxID=69319 RepID=UPI000440007F|nr:2-(3-amino-3-carboxypropyl)histidine synthase subunit 2 [Microplitis demolitor]
MTPSNCLVNHESNSLNLETAKKLEYYYLNNCVEWIKARGLKTVCLQFPDTLLKDSAIIALELEKLLGHKVYILGDTTCGSCCVDEVAADHIKADGIIHFGHACLNPTIKLPIFHVLPRCNIDIDIFIQSFCDYFDCDRNILFFYDVSYAHAIESIWKKLKENNYNKIKLTLLNCKSNVGFTDKKSDDSDQKKVIIGRELLLNDDKFEDFVGFYLGDNNKTLASFALSIPVQNWYYCTGKIEEESIKMNINEFEVTKNPWLRRRRFLVEKLKDAKVIGIVVATLGIKNYLDVLDMIKSILKRKNIKSYIFSVGKPNPAKLANFAEVDAFVVIACPENEIFDSKDYYKPLCTPFEVELAFNDSREFSTNYCLDFRQLLPGGINYVEFKSTDQSDISLITGKLRNYSSKSADQTDTEKMKTLACKNDGTVAIGKAGADFLLNRSWQGLEQKLGETEVKTAEQGRRGLPINYDTEPLINKI